MFYALYQISYTYFLNSGFNIFIIIIHCLMLLTKSIFFNSEFKMFYSISAILLFIHLFYLSIHLITILLFLYLSRLAEISVVSMAIYGWFVSASFF